MTTRSDASNRLKEYFKRWPRFYYFVFDVLGPVYFGGLSPWRFLERYHTGGTCYNLGSGARVLRADVVNMDITPYPGVSLVGDICNVPLSDGAATSVVCDQVLEHVAEPARAVAEIKRVLVRGGYAYVSTPFLYPFHASPSDYQRWTHAGLRRLFERYGFEVVDIGVRSGPCSALATHLSYGIASLLSCGSATLYWVLVYASLPLVFPIKCLDVLGNRLPFAVHMAAVLYCVVRRP